MANRSVAIFARLHIYYGAWGTMWDGTTTDECAVCVGDAATWNNGNIRWDRSYLNRDHFWGHGNVDPDLVPARQACLLWYWTEG